MENVTQADWLKGAAFGRQAAYQEILKWTETTQQGLVWCQCGNLAIESLREAIQKRAAEHAAVKP